MSGDCCPSVSDRKIKRLSATIEREVGLDFLMMLDALSAPKENVIAVVVRVDAQANSSDNRRSFAEQVCCEQLLFMRSSRTVDYLYRTVIDASVGNHSFSSSTMPKFQHQVPLHATDLCQCDRMHCPGLADRRRAWVERMHMPPDTPMMIMRNRCYLTSKTFSKLHTVGTHDRPALFQDQWIVFDTHTRRPLFADKGAAARSNTRFPFANAGTRAPLLLDFEQTIAEQSTGGGTNYLHMAPVDASMIADVRNKSHHTTPLCVEKVQALFERRWSMCADDAHTECDNCSEEAVGHTMALLRSLCDEAIATTTQTSPHDHTCNCLMDTFLQRHCAHQIEITLVPMPTNDLYVDMLDAACDIRSSLVRRVFVERASVVSRVDLKPNENRDWLVVDHNAPVGAARHFDTVLFINQSVQLQLANKLGNFCIEYGRVGERRYSYTDEFGLNKHRYSDYVAKHLESPNESQRRKFEQFTGTAPCKIDLSKDVYTQVVSQSRLAFEIDDATCTTLFSIMMKRRAFSRDLMQKRSAWMPPLAQWVVHGFAQYDDFDEYMELVDEERTVNNAAKRVMCANMERVLVEEAIQCRNWRLVMARAIGLMCTTVGSIPSFVFCAVQITSMILILNQLDELGCMQKKEKLAEADAAAAAAAAALALKKTAAAPKPQVPKKKPVSAKTAVAEPPLSVATAEAPPPADIAVPIAEAQPATECSAVEITEVREEAPPVSVPIAPVVAARDSYTAPTPTAIVRVEKKVAAKEKRPRSKKLPAKQVVQKKKPVSPPLVAADSTWTLARKKSRSETYDRRVAGKQESSPVSDVAMQTPAAPCMGAQEDRGEVECAMARDVYVLLPQRRLEPHAVPFMPARQPSLADTIRLQNNLDFFNFTLVSDCFFSADVEGPCASNIWKTLSTQPRLVNTSVLF